MDEDKARPDEDKIDLIINKKIADAKLNVSESRLRFVLWFGLAFITVFGIALPWLQTQRSSEEVDRAVQRVDTAIEKMDGKFAELAGEQLRKPEIECYLDNKKLEGAELHIEGTQGRVVQLQNTGDRVASTVHVRLYTKKDARRSIGWRFDRDVITDEPDFKFGLKYDPGNLGPLQAGDFMPITFRPIEIPVPTMETEAMLKVFYGRPEPKRVRFAITSSPPKKKE